ncbi:discoidin domain-containing receptor tyrosine kinase B-like isoform X2 [Daphnia pulicaria]|uniref:discoidin domain-containing receptor tyrosine kinase B-like isoform X2 n=1 Tax=Daphnia pulicaria TaxID=35523 RepID=UPI001EEB2A0A|nr:discoidin domain-containing receptor tyrosine kinase B-like isoform X2 [Daphnia pulicaria]
MDEMKRKCHNSYHACVLILTWMCTLSKVVSLDTEGCHQQPMGMQSGTIPDLALSSSSAFDIRLGPQHARLNIDRSGGAWCPKQQIAENVKEYLQINLANVSVINGIATQGRYGNGRGQEYAEQFKLEYWRPELDLWHTYRQRDGNDIFEGNWDTTTVIHHDLYPPIITKSLRVIPYGVHPRTVCMRTELYGCIWNAENVSTTYSTPGRASVRDSVIVEDKSYDGFKDHSQLTRSGGLWMLTDGEYGLTNFKVNSISLEGQGWVGWKTHDSIKEKPIELVFNFGAIRNFSAVHIHTGNQFAKHVQVFSKASLRFSSSGLRFSQQYINYFYMEDLALENPRNVTIRIPHLCAAFVKIQLWFAAPWIMISEVTFDSNVIEEHKLKNMMLVDVAASEQNEDVLLQNESRPPSESTILNTASFRGYFEAIVGALSAAMLLLITAIVIIIVMSHRKKTVQENLVAFNVPFDIDTLNGKESVMGFSSTTEKTNTISKFQYVLPVNEKKDLILEYAVSSPTKSWTATQPIRVQQQYNTLHNHIPTTRRDKASSFNSYVNPCVATIPNKGILDGKSGRMATRSSDVSSIAWNIKPQSHRFAVDNLPEAHVPEIPKQSLKSLEWLGSSADGEAHICHVEKSGGGNVLIQKPVMVRWGAVKEMDHFMDEIRLLSSIDHPNICFLLAYSYSAGMGYAIFECPIYGDLNSYLKHLPLISNKSVFKLSCQIARAVKYLEEKGMVHKDLATRNCLVGPDLQIKICDLAIICAAFKDDYGEVRGRKSLPIRWIAWETIVMDKFTYSSSVWMLAVTVWEISTVAKEKPYGSMNDTQVILNADHFFYADGKQVILPKPKGRPCQLYKWMAMCWSRDEAKRPSLNESVTFLDQLTKDY